jgi:hypothetical protein
MFVVEIVRDRDELIIKSLIARLVAANQQDRYANRIKGIEDPNWLPAALHAQLAHMTVTRAIDAG